jgi:glycosyltransferase involved in cell wall biosynthesis
MAEFFHGGGYLPALIPLAQGLRDEGHTVTLIGTNNRTEIEGVISFKYKLFFNWYFSYPLAKWLIKNITSFDVIHINGLWSFPQLISVYFSKKFNKPYILTPHGIFLDPKRYGGLKKNIYLNLFSKKMIEDASCIHVTSNLEFIGIDKLRFKTPNIKLIPWSISKISKIKSQVDLHNNIKNLINKWPLLPNKKMILFISRISPEKGLRELLIALNEVKKTHTDFILVIAGEGNTHKLELLKIICKFGLEDYVFFAGLVLGNEKNLLLHNAHFFILPSHGENFSFAVAEALAAELPVITTDRTPWSEIDNVDAGRFIPLSINNLVVSINEMLSLPKSTLKEMGKRGKKLIDEKYSIINVTSQFLAMYYNSVSKYKN